MRYDCDKWRDRRNARWQAKWEWHPWFAWWPVRIAHNDCRWLETVERKLCASYSYDYYYEYRSNK